MIGRSIKASPEGIKLAKKALISKQWKQADLVGHVCYSRQPISKFFTGKTLSNEIFVKICEKLGLNWQEIADLPEDNRSQSRRGTSHPKDKPETPIDINKLVNKLRQQVNPKIETHCGTMRILDMSQPIGLGKIYTKVNILEKIIGRRRKEIAQLIKYCSLEDFEHFNLGSVIEEKIPGKDAVTKYNKLLILGKPGAGKTTFLKHLAIQCNNNQFQGDLVPFFVTLKDFAEAEDRTLLNYICSYFELKNQNDLQEVLTNKKTLILLDGLDEVLEKDSHRVIKEIENLTNKYPKNQYILTCRIAAKEYTFEKFTEVEIADFDWEQTTIFVNNWFKNKAITAETFLSRLEKDEPIKELVSNPLLLTLLCISFEELGDFPANRKELYEEGLDVLLKKWDAKRGIQRDRVYKPLSVAKKEDLLSKIAWNTFATGAYFFKQDKAKIYISEYIRNLPGANLDDEALQVPSGIVLRNIEAQHGLLVARAKNIYSFSHLTFQEYFTAREIILVRQSDNEALQELVSHIFDKRWREVFLLAVAMSPNAEKLVLLMKDKIDSLLAGDKDLQKYLEWLARKATEINIKYQQKNIKQIQRAGKFYINLDRKISQFFYFSLDLVHNLGINLNIDPELYINHNHNPDFYLYLCLNPKRYIKRDPILNLNLNLEVAQELDSKLYSILLKLKNRLIKVKHTSEEKFEAWWKINGQAWSKDFRNAIIKHQNIGHDWQFNKHQKNLLEQYYRANQLLTECLHHECYVSPEVRQQIEETLLLPIAEIEKY